MATLAIFAAPKPFEDPHIVTIQRNAILSWKRIPDVEILLMGRSAGIAETAAEVGVRHVDDVSVNASGTPLVSSMVERARDCSEAPYLCVINSDIILMPGFVKSVEVAGRARVEFVLLARRWDLDLGQRLDFTHGWDIDLQELARQRGSLHRPKGSDFFVFPRHCYADIPPFAIGRSGWDNWMIYRARHEGWAVIDATPSVTVIHQNHDYGHLPEGRPHYDMPESVENIRLAGGQAAIRYTLLDATDLLQDGSLKTPPLTGPRLVRNIERRLRSTLRFLPEEKVEELVRPRRWKNRVLRLLGKHPASIRRQR